MPTWMRNLPSGLAAATAVPVGSVPPLRISVLLDHPLDFVASAAGGIDAVVDGVGAGDGGGGGEADEPPNQPANGFQEPLDCFGAVCVSCEPTASDAEAVRVARVAGTAGATGS